MILRFDDVHCGCDFPKLRWMSDTARKYGFDVWWAVSVLYHSDAEGERVFPRIMGARSDHTEFFEADLCGVPFVPYGIKACSHGIVHVDHRLLTRSQQEMSISTSCSLIGAAAFVPPFNKYNDDTVNACRGLGVDLIRFENGWRSAEHNNRADCDTNLWYCHHRRFSADDFLEWIMV